MGKVFCRTFQAVMKVGNYFLGYRIPERLQGAGCITKLPDIIEENKINNVILVTDKFLTSNGMNRSLMDALEKKGIKYTLFTDFQPNPTSDNVESGYKLFKENGCKGIIAFGGGSSMDCAKGIAAKAVHPRKSIAQLQGLLTVIFKTPTIFAVPTTSGTGSETTLAAVITDSKTHHKASINDPALFPKYAVLDPELTKSLPPFITATTGMDALCHAVESYTNNTYCTGLEKDFAKKAVKLIYDNILIAYQNGDDLTARQNMQNAAFYAGRSFTRGCVGYVHAVGHTLSGLYGLAHGLAMSVILPHVMRQFGPAVWKRLADLADVCGIEGKTTEEKANAFIYWIEETNAKMGLPTGFSEIKEEDIPQMIKWAKKEANPLYPVPVIWGSKDFRKLIESIKN